MNPHRRPDPVTAIAEADATSRTAEIFADIRDVMQIPLITSIWRTLDAVEGGLDAVWTATRPLYLSGWPDALLQTMEAEIAFPRPARLTRRQSRDAGLTAGDRDGILAVCDAYNRSNGLNLIALTALVRRPEGAAVNSVGRPTLDWPELAPLPRPDQIAEAEWALLRRAAQIGLAQPGDDIPTLWRHLLRWPAVVNLIVEHFAPLDSDGVLARTVSAVEDFAEANAVVVSGFADRSVVIPAEAMRMVEAYVGRPPSVARMAAVGRCAATWLAASDWGEK
ncbi:MAG: hypothetical protein GY798_09550 [Hyphomicrobiales bacterium]|nr:hypothetical protein [Hyphomicrobiales bacterium]